MRPMFSLGVNIPIVSTGKSLEYFLELWFILFSWSFGYQDLFQLDIPVSLLLIVPSLE